MKKSASIPVLLVLLGATTLTARSFLDDSSRWYVGASGGVGFVAGSKFSMSGSSGNIDWGLAKEYLVRTGYEWQNLRVEGEFSYLDMDVDKMSLSGSGETFETGTFDSYSLMLNAIGDIEFGGQELFIGLGAGARRLEYDGSVMDYDNDTVFAYQFLAGAIFHLTDSLDLRLNYKFTGSEDFYDGSIDLEGVAVNLFEFGVDWGF